MHSTGGAAKASLRGLTRQNVSSILSRCAWRYPATIPLARRQSQGPPNPIAAVS